MKKFKLIITVAVLAVISYSCNNSAVERMVDKMQPEPVVLEQEGAGFFVNQPDEKFVVGSDDVMDIWMKYIDAHNNKDLDVIREMNADSTQQFGSFKVFDAFGDLVDGVDSHIEKLSGWFEAENPQWNTFFSYTMKVDGQIGEWVISGHRLKRTVDGEEKMSVDLADVYIEDGKIGAFYIYTRAVPPPPPAE